MTNSQKRELCKVEVIKALETMEIELMRLINSTKSLVLLSTPNSQNLYERAQSILNESGTEVKKALVKLALTRNHWEDAKRG